MPSAPAVADRVQAPAETADHQRQTALRSDGPDFLQRLAQRRAAPAVIAAGRTFSDAELDRLVDRTAARLGSGRRLVAISAANTLPCIVGYLAALRAGHVVLMAPACRTTELAEAYEADTVVAGAEAAGGVAPDADSAFAISLRHDEPAHDLHPDLALLLSTSGSTGSPKLVRLSRHSLESNASAIARALGLRRTDRAITTLSPAYSYGLSVLNSHLAAGAALVLTDDSVTEPAFWELARREQVTTLAGVPYTFELLDAVGFSGSQLPSLRLMTCAGGRLPTETAVRYAAMGEASGWGLSLMYGATEATARMAIQPASQTAAHPDCVGSAVPGGQFHIADPGPDGVGRLVYRGPNVMMGYAQTPADLARGPELAELVTGDRARITPDGLLQITGRSTTFAKVYGLRIDLDDVDRALRAAGYDAVAVALDGRIGVAAGSGADRTGLARAVADVVCAATGVPVTAVSVAGVAELPRTHSGKVDRAAAAELLATTVAAQDADDPLACEADLPLTQLLETYTKLLGKPAHPDDSFRSLGGDSLSYVAASIAVERICGRLPRHWHGRTVAELAAVPAQSRAHRLAAAARDDGARTAAGGPAGPAVPRWLRSHQAETTVLLRALAIVLVVGSHAGVMDVRGGAHVLIALAGFNLARFSLAERDLAVRARKMARSAADVLVPALLWVAVLAAMTTTYTWNILGTNWLVNPTTENADWRYWFVESLVWLLPLVALAVRIPALERLRQRYPFGLPAVAAGVAWAMYQMAVPEVRPVELFSPPAVLWLFLLGWTIAAARSRPQQLLATALILLAVPETFAASRAIVVPVAIVLLIWADRVRLPAPVLAVVAALAEASLFIYLSHWQVLEVVDGWAALLLALPIGIVISRAITAARRRTRPWFATVRPAALRPGWAPA